MRHATLSILLLFLTACGGPQETSTTAPESAPAEADATRDAELPGVIVDADWLNTHLNRVRVVDVRPADAYAATHIPGALHLNPRDLNAGRDVADPEAVAQTLGQAGVSHEDTLVVVGSSDDYRPAARTFWVLELHGHPSVAVLNGGIEGWSRGERPLTGAATEVAPTTFAVTLRPELRADAESTLAATSDERVAIIDSRSEGDYTGATGKPFAPRHGHIPTAINVTAVSTLVDVDGVPMFPSSEELRALYAPHLEARERAITYCNGGNAASVGYLELRAAGFAVGMYDGSWGDWSTREELPMSTGDAP